MSRKKNEAEVVFGEITQWSYSRRATHKQCPYKAYLMYVMKMKVAAGPAAARGVDAHKQAENFILSKADYPVHEAWNPEVWGDMLTELRDLRYKAEQQWAFDRHWTIADWFTDAAWCRMVLDAHRVTRRRLHGVDFKTGQIREDEHAEQSDLYALGCFQQYPTIEEVTMEFWYLDKEDVHEYTYYRSDADALRKRWTEEGLVICTDQELEPNPGAACRAFGGCPFAANKGGPCGYNTRGEYGDG